MLPKRRRTPLRHKSDALTSPARKLSGTGRRTQDLINRFRMVLLCGTLAAFALGAYAPAVYADNLGVVRARAAAGDARALTQLGMAYYFGRDVAADLPKALGLLGEARAAGDSLALAMLGVHALREQKMDEALELLRQAAAAGHALAQRNLAALYLRGADPSPGLALLEAAVGQGDAASMLTLATYLAQREPAQANDAGRARELLRRAAALGEPRAQLRLAEQLLDDAAPEHTDEAGFFLRTAGVYTNNTAWVLATAPQAERRDGARAVRLMEILLDSPDPRNGEWVDTLAAAYAEIGRFDAAVATQEEAIALLEGEADPSLLDGMRARLADYQARKPYREALP
ncbi:MAG: hypothetical protein AAGA68_00245 [Pseudomonadota bacterium]